VIVADTGAIVALIDADDDHHETLLSLYEERPAEWILPWAILPEVDYLLGTHVSERAQRAFIADLGSGAFTVEWGSQLDLARARKICEQYRSLKLGLVDASVMAVAERLKARAIATLDVRDFAAVKIAGAPKLIPRDA
jgi:predicted nucleic acid-binding protein